MSTDRKIDSMNAETQEQIKFMSQRHDGSDDRKYGVEGKNLQTEHKLDIQGRNRYKHIIFHHIPDQQG